MSEREMIYPGRHTAVIDGDFVVFLIGARVHKPWRFHQWLPVTRAMTTMQGEIASHPEIGCLHIENYGSLRNISVQYWRSFEHLESFARSDRWSHLESWRRFNQLIKDSGDLGIWHETYQVGAGAYEAMYGNMARFGLARAGRHLPIGVESTAARRAGARGDDVAPVVAY